MTRTLFAFSLLLAGPAIAADGPTIYKRCAACHLSSGAGVPSAYPPLASDFRALSATAKGRRYLILAVIKGVAGPIVVDGKNYRGIMPAQSGLDDTAVAAVLNYVTTGIAKAAKGSKSFTAAEVAAVRASSAGLNAAAVGKLHKSAGGK